MPVNGAVYTRGGEKKSEIRKLVTPEFRMIQQNALISIGRTGRKDGPERQRSKGRSRRVPLTVIRGGIFFRVVKERGSRILKRRNKTTRITMKVILLPCAVIIAITSSAYTSPVARDGVQSKFFFDSFPKGITISRVTTEDQTPQPAPGYSIRFVPLITLLAGLFPNFISKLGQFTGVNKYVNTRRFDLAAPAQQNATSSMEDEDDFSGEEDDFESELIECDAAHLGLWPDKSDSQRYYKCEIDPRTPATATCIKDLFQGKHMDKSDMEPLEKIEVPGVKPCFLLSMMKCANGFKYQHKTRICVPDIVFASRS